MKLLIEIKMATINSILRLAMFSAIILVSCPDPTPKKGKRGLVNIDTILGPLHHDICIMHGM